jgi:hypothetical protein
MYSSTLSLTLALDGMGGQDHAPANLLPGKTRYPLYGRLGGPQGRSGQVREISRPPGFDPRTVQVAASRYNGWDIPTPKEESVRYDTVLYKQGSSLFVSLRAAFLLVSPASDEWLNL